MIAVAIGIWAVVAVLAAVVNRRHGPTGLRRGGAFALGQARALAIRLPLAMLAAAFLAEALPIEDIASVIGPQSGLAGIVLAALIGGVMPGGPMTSFPLALIVYEGGAGAPQIVALLAGWSVFAMHRVLAYEAPMMGWGFVALRMSSCALLPVLAGLLAEAVLALTGALTGTLTGPLTGGLASGPG